MMTGPQLDLVSTVSVTPNAAFEPLIDLCDTPRRGDTVGTYVPVVKHNGDVKNNVTIVG